MSSTDPNPTTTYGVPSHTGATTHLGSPTHTGATTMTAPPETVTMRHEPPPAPHSGQHPKVSETKPSLATSELWLTLAGIAALIVVHLLADDPDLDLWRTAQLCTAIGIAYLLSRGIAKSGSRNERWTDDRGRR